MKYESTDEVNGQLCGPEPYPVTKKQIAGLMGISLSTLKRQLKASNLHIKRGLISPLKQSEILETLGWAKVSPDEPK